MQFAAHQQSSHLDPAVIAALIAALASLLTLAVQIFGIRRVSKDTNAIVHKQLDQQREQLDRTLAEERLRTLNERFAMAADRLGADKSAAVRLAAVYAMAGLADDWADNRQTCVDVLCAYLRMPYAPDPGESAPTEEQLAFGADREVRHTVIRVITARLRQGAPVSWQGLDFDFTGVRFDGGDFSNAQFSSGAVSFLDAEFSDGQVFFDGAQFSGGQVNFGGAQFSGSYVSFYYAGFSGGYVSFEKAGFSAGYLVFDGTEFSGGQVNFNVAQFRGGGISFDETKFAGSEVSFDIAHFSASQVSFERAEFAGSKVSFFSARFSGGEVVFDSAMLTRGSVRFDNAKFSGSDVSFPGAKFSGSEVHFKGAEFSGGKVDISRPQAWSHPPVFPFQGTAPSMVKLPDAKRLEQGYRHG